MQNLLVSEDNVVKIADFGISKMLGGSTEQIQDSAGTPAFMSPEQCGSLAHGFSGQVTRRRISILFYLYIYLSLLMYGRLVQLFLC